MSISPLKDISSAGITRGIQNIRKNASLIANSPREQQTFPTRDAVRAMVELHENALQVSASVTAFKTADNVIGSLLDVKA